MDEKRYKLLMTVAIVLTAAWVGWTFYDTTPEKEAGDMPYLAANKYFEDGEYQAALAEYEEALRQDPNHLHALRGKARTLLKLQRLHEALRVADEAIAREPDFAATYANRGIIYDFLGEYEAAIEDYETALRLDPELAEGPGWLTRFLRNQAKRPPTVADRARYLRAELEKPEGERLLRVPEKDSTQRPFKL